MTKKVESANAQWIFFSACALKCVFHTKKKSNTVITFNSAELREWNIWNGRDVYAYKALDPLARQGTELRRSQKEFLGLSFRWDLRTLLIIRYAF